jgi:hypothetical protein
MPVIKTLGILLRTNVHEILGFFCGLVLKST